MNPSKTAINQSDAAHFLTKGVGEIELFLIRLNGTAILTLASSQVPKNSFQVVGQVTGKRRFEAKNLPKASRRTWENVQGRKSNHALSGVSA